MAEVKWIKITTSMFDDEKIKLIRKMPESDAILLTWIQLLVQAGKANASGNIILSQTIPYTEEMLAAIFDRPIHIIRLALQTFRQFGMVDIEDGVISISNWEKHQNIDGMEKIKEQNRLRKQRERERKKVLLPAIGQRFCAYCGKNADSVDHIIPQSKGGKDIPENLVDCCKGCNSSKKDKDLAEFLNDAKLLYYDIDLNLILKNKKLTKYVTRDVTGQFTRNHATDIDIDLDIEKEKEYTATTAMENPFSFWEQNGFGTISPLLTENINYWLDGLFFDNPEQVVIHAMKEALLNNARSWKYVESTLTNWKNRNLRTLADVQGHIAAYKAKKGGGNNRAKRNEESDSRPFDKSEYFSL